MTSLKVFMYFLPTSNTTIFRRNDFSVALKTNTMADCRFGDYERLIFVRGVKNYHILPWGQILVRNIDDKGQYINI